MNTRKAKAEKFALQAILNGSKTTTSIYVHYLITHICFQTLDYT